MENLTLVVSRGEAVALNNALNEVLNGPAAIAQWEFDSRVGCPRHEAQALHHRLRELLGGADAQ